MTANDEVERRGIAARPHTELFYPDHRLPPWPTEDATPRSLEPIVRTPTWRVAQLLSTVSLLIEAHRFPRGFPIRPDTRRRCLLIW